MLDEIDDVGSIPGVQGHPDAGRDLDFLAFDHHGSRQGLSDLFDDDRRGLGGRLPLAREIRHQDDELIAPPAGSGVALAQAPGKARGDFAQQPIPGRMPQRIVDRLEAVEVQKQYRHPLAGALGPGERHPQPVFEQRAVGKPGEPIVERELMQPGLRGPAGGSGTPSL